MKYLQLCVKYNGTFSWLQGIGVRVDTKLNMNQQDAQRGCGGFVLGEEEPESL